MLKKHAESDLVKTQIQKLNQALQNKATELEYLEEAEAVEALEQKIKLQEEDLVLVEPSMYACVRSLNHNVLCLPRTTVEIVQTNAAPADAEIESLYEELEYLMDEDQDFAFALNELDELMDF